MFVLMLAMDYEGEVLLGVYSSEDRAWSEAAAFIDGFVRAASTPRRVRAASERFEVREVEVDAAAQYHW